MGFQNVFKPDKLKAKQNKITTKAIKFCYQKKESLMAMSALEAESLYFLFCLGNLCKQYFLSHLVSDFVAV